MKTILALAALLTGSVVGAEPARYIIGFNPGSSPAERASALRVIDANELGELGELSAVVAEVPAEGLAMVAEVSGENGPITVVEEDFFIRWIENTSPVLPAFVDIRSQLPRFHSHAAPTPILPSGVVAAEIPWGIARVNAPAAWTKSQGRGVKVAVVDTGIDASHPDLRGKVAGCYNALDSGAPCADDNGHGTHVSGTIAAAWDGKGVAGVAPGASLYAVKVLDKEGSSSLSSVIKGLIWCGKNDIQVANLSLGAPTGSVFMRLALKYAAGNGVAVIAAAGNDDGKAVGYPAAYPEAIAVTASDSRDGFASFSNKGRETAFIAPGVGVKSSVPGGRYGIYSGTSMATPHVAGLAALAVSRGARGEAGVRAALSRAARPLPGLSTEQQGRGLPDAGLLTQ